jgi:RNA polymerase sigma-70 factor (ECF subfamily)
MPLFGKKKYSSLRELVLACQQQKPRAQHAFYERYKSRLLGVCRRYARTEAEAEDIFQEAFIKIFTHIQELQNPEAADSWVRSILIRTAINYYNRTTQPNDRFSSYDDQVETVASDDYEGLIRQLTLDALLTFIQQLPDMYRIVVNLYLVEGYNHGEIAELLTIPETTVRSQYSRARQLLIKTLQQNGIERHELFG